MPSVKEQQRRLSLAINRTANDYSIGGTPSAGYDNPTFRRGFSFTSSVPFSYLTGGNSGTRTNGNNKSYKGIVTSVDTVVMDDGDLAEAPTLDGNETDLDAESFRSDLERDSAHSSLVNQVQGYRSNNGTSRRSPTAPYHASGQPQEQNVGLPVHPTNMTEHEVRHEQLLKQGNYRESQRELQKISRTRFPRPPYEELSRQHIPEDAENAPENDIDGNPVESFQNIGATNASYKERDSIATTLEDVQIRMMHQDYPQNYDLAFKAQENLRIPSISGTSNVGDELYGVDGQQTSQGIRSMTERFRYPPKSYTKYNSSDMLEDSHDEPTPGVCSPNTTSKPTLTSSVSQKIHMDRIQNENDRTRRKLGDSSNSRSSRITERGVKHINQRSRKYLQAPSSGVSSLGLHSYAGKASFVGSMENNDPTSPGIMTLENDPGSSHHASNVAIVRPRPSQRNPIISSTTVETGNDIPPIKRPRNRKWHNLFGVIDTEKLERLFGRGYEDEGLAYNPRYSTTSQTGHGNSGLATIPEDGPPPSGNFDPVAFPKGPHEDDSDSVSTSKETFKSRSSCDVLFYGSIISFISGILLLMSFASPYWLQSWAGTESPFENMGLWEFCFHNFRHPDYQYDELFNGCHWIWGNEYRYIREKLLPGWLIVVQFFATLALMASYMGQCITVALLLRWPLDIILRFEVWFCGSALVLNACASALMFLSVIIFYAQCWARDWLLYPNWNYPSWSYAFACFTCVGHCIAAIFLYWDAVKAKERKAKNKALLMQMHPQASLGFSSLGRRELYAGGSYATGGGAHGGHGASGGSGYI